MLLYIRYEYYFQLNVVAANHDIIYIIIIVDNNIIALFLFYIYIIINNIPLGIEPKAAESGGDGRGVDMVTAPWVNGTQYYPAEEPSADGYYLSADKHCPSAHGQWNKSVLMPMDK